MEMPKNCMSCPFPAVGVDAYYCYCPTQDGKEYDFKYADTIPDTCPLVEIPTPHGRLGDLDALKAQYKYGEADSEDEKLWMMNIRRAITNAPTVIEAEGSE
jgi:hypothetical protein